MSSGSPALRMDFIVSDKTSSLLDGLKNANRLGGPGMKGLLANVLQCGFPAQIQMGHMRLLNPLRLPVAVRQCIFIRNEEEHFVVLPGTYRILIDNRVFDAPVGALLFFAIIPVSYSIFCYLRVPACVWIPQPGILMQKEITQMAERRGSTVSWAGYRVSCRLLTIGYTLYE
jgi:hypothetical protein